MPRNRYTADEWEYASSGRCDWETEYGGVRGVSRCGDPSDPDAVYGYCTGHDGEAREYPTYGN